MGATDLIQELARLGLSITLVPEGIHISPRSAITDEVRALIKANREAIVQALQQQRSNRSEERRQSVAAMLARSPNRRYALVSDEADPRYPDCVVLAVAMRTDDGNTYTCDVIVSKERFDGLLAIELLERHSGTVQ